MEAAEQREQESSHSGDVMQMQSGWGQLDLTPPCCIRPASTASHAKGSRLAWPEFCKRSKLMRLILLPTLRSGQLPGSRETAPGRGLMWNGWHPDNYSSYDD